MKITKYVLAILALLLLSAHGAEERTSFFKLDWLDAVVSIEATDQTGKIQSIGTGFLVLSPSNHIMLVTAKHVVIERNGKVRSGLGYRLNSKENASIIISDQQASMSTKSGWFFSEEADVACRFIVWDAKRNQFKNLSMSLFLKTERLQPCAPLYILGFPMGLRSENHAIPIVRQGIVARCDSNSILAEAFVFPGNSGGPVIYAPTFPVDQKTLKSPVLQGQWIVGLVSESIAYVDHAISRQSMRTRVIFEDNSGLVNVVPANAVLKLLTREDVKKVGESKF